MPFTAENFNKLGEYMRKESTNKHVNGREAFSVPNAMAQGMHLSMMGHAPGERAFTRSCVRSTCGGFLVNANVKQDESHTGK